MGNVLSKMSFHGKTSSVFTKLRSDNCLPKEAAAAAPTTAGLGWILYSHIFIRERKLKKNIVFAPRNFIRSPRRPSCIPNIYGFLINCSRCNRDLNGLDIYIYRGELSFCSYGCRVLGMRSYVQDEEEDEHLSAQLTRQSG